MRVIAELEVTFAEGERKTRGAVRIGEPRLVSHDEAVCVLELVGLAPGAPLRYEVRGADTLQALSLTLSLARERLRAFVARGGRLLVPGDDEADDADREGDVELPLEAYFR